MTVKIKKAVIPAAGRGTRLLPATISQPKEMLPIVDKPIIQMIIEELTRGGIEEFLIITGRTKRAIEDHFDPDPVLETELEKNSRNGLLERVREVLDYNIDFKRQRKLTGLADAIGTAEKWVGGEHFVVALGDTLYRCNDSYGTITGRLVDAHRKYNSYATLVAEEVGMERIERYGALKVECMKDRVHRVLDLVEKPKREVAPSSLAITGLYALAPEIFDMIRSTKMGIGGERQLTDAIRIFVQKNYPVYAIELERGEKRYDIGSPADFAKTFIEFAAGNDEIGPEIRGHIEKMVGEWS